MYTYYVHTRLGYINASGVPSMVRVPLFNQSLDPIMLTLFSVSALVFSIINWEIFTSGYHDGLKALENPLDQLGTIPHQQSTAKQPRLILCYTLASITLAVTGSIYLIKLIPYLCHYITLYSGNIKTAAILSYSLIIGFMLLTVINALQTSFTILHTLFQKGIDISLEEANNTLACSGKHYLPCLAKEFPRPMSTINLNLRTYEDSSSNDLDSEFGTGTPAA